MSGKISTIYFSPTHTTQKIVQAIGDVLAQKTGKERLDIDLTLPDERGREFAFGSDDILLFGFPVYGGRIPRVLEETLSKLKCDKTPAIIVAAYGNRDYDDALLEAKDILQAKGFTVVAAGAFIGEHSFSRSLAAGRPDENDIETAALFAEQIADKLEKGNYQELSVKGSRPYKEHMAPMPFTPKTKDTCTSCMICARSCPMGIIDTDSAKVVNPGCIQCNACVKSCPVEAKYFDAEPILKAAAMMESNFMSRKEAEYFL